MNKIATAGILIACGLAVGPSWAADVSVRWQNPEQYTDIDPADQTQEQFNAALFNNLDSVFAALARKLPESYHWEITVTDLDLAGDVAHPAGTSGRPVRVVRDNFRPAISFHYTLSDAQGHTIRQDSVELKDPNFMSRSRRLLEVNTRLYPYEEAMLRQWFESQQNQKILPAN